MRSSILATATAAIFCISVVPVRAGDNRNTAPINVQNTLAGDPNRIVCRPGTPPTGSRIGPRRICATQREWKKRQRDDGNWLDDVQSRSLQFCMNC